MFHGVDSNVSVLYPSAHTESDGVTATAECPAGRAPADRPQASERTNESTNPAAVLRATAGPPCSKASGINVSAREAITAPAAKASGREMVSGSAPDRGPGTHHHSDHEQRCTGGPKTHDGSGRLALAAHGCSTHQRFRQVGYEDGREKRQAAGTLAQRHAEGNVLRHAVKRHGGQQGHAGSPAGGHGTRRFLRRGSICVQLRTSPELVCGRGSGAPGCAQRSSNALRAVKTAAPTISPTAARQIPPCWYASSNSSKLKAVISAPAAKDSRMARSRFGSSNRTPMRAPRPGRSKPPRRKAATSPHRQLRSRWYLREESGRGQFAPARPQGGGGKSKAIGRRREVSAVVLLRGVCLLASEKGWARTRFCLPVNSRDMTPAAWRRPVENRVFPGCSRPVMSLTRNA